MASPEKKEEPKRINTYFKVDNPAGLSLVRIYIGPERALWVLPKEFLCDRVSYFKSAFQSGFRESTEKALELPEDDPIAFAFVIDYIFQQWDNRNTINAVNNINDHHAVQMAWCKIYVLADKLNLPKVARVADDNYVDYMYRLNLNKRIVSPGAAKFLYENTPDSSVLRQSLADLAVEQYQELCCPSAEFMKEWSESAASHPQFHFDIMLRLKELSRPVEEVFCVHDACAIHEHHRTTGAS